MKRVVFIGVFVLLVASLFAQKQTRISKKELRKEQNEIKASKVDSLLMNQSFTFIAHVANPIGWQPIHLTSTYDIQLNKDSVFVHLPYFGRAYTSTMGDSEGGIKFESSIDNYELEQKKKRYEISFDAKSINDKYQFHLSVFPSGYGTLNVSCTNRQSISFDGQLNLPDE